MTGSQSNAPFEPNNSSVEFPECETVSGAHSEATRAFLLTVAYNGSTFCGWQYQPDQPSVQETLEGALKAVLGHPCRAFASSRTDTGVHAIGQAALVRTFAWRAPPERLPCAVNTHLPSSIVTRHAREVPLNFHPLRDSTGKRYRYQIYGSRRGDPIHSNTHWWVRRKLDLEAMRAAAVLLVGTHDFCSFQSTGSPRSTTTRTVRSLTISAAEHLDGQLFTIEIEANGFLYNMVRNIVGTLVQVGVGREAPEWIVDVLAAKDRRAAGATAPPQGLFLTEVLF